MFLLASQKLLGVIFFLSPSGLLKYFWLGHVNIWGHNNINFFKIEGLGSPISPMFLPTSDEILVGK